MIDPTQIIISLGSGVFGAGGIGAYFAYKQKMPLTQKEAEKIQQDIETGIALRWRDYSKQLEERANQLEERLDIQEKSIQEMRILLTAKNEEITNLKEGNKQLRIRVTDLETELSKYRTVDKRVEGVREDLHQEVDTSIDKLTS
ncbi:MAG: hypothetical protein ACR2N3_17825 [Pyrinomonadaceae bacterium]